MRSGFFTHYYKIGIELKGTHHHRLHLSNAKRSYNPKQCVLNRILLKKQFMPVSSTWEVHARGSGFEVHSCCFKNSRGNLHAAMREATFKNCWIYNLKMPWIFQCFCSLKKIKGATSQLRQPWSHTCPEEWLKCFLSDTKISRHLSSYYTKNLCKPSIYYTWAWHQL